MNLFKYYYRAVFAMGCSLLLEGCVFDMFDSLLTLNSKGPVGANERDVIVIATGLMLLVVIPVFVLIFWFAWKYRASNTAAEYAPEWDYSRRLEITIWLIPLAIIIALGTLTWFSTHKLDPYNPLASTAKPVTVEVVALDWKWLFIYPDYGIAVVNQLVLPVNVPVNFKLTSDTVMASFMIPQLGGQIYAMAGMQTQLHLMASAAGSYYGRNYQYDGRGFSGMKFQAVATSAQAFAEWIKRVKAGNSNLDLRRYQKIASPSAETPISYFSSVKPGLFSQIMAKYSDESDRRHMLHMSAGK